MNRDLIMVACVLIWIPTAAVVCIMILAAIVGQPDEFIKV